MIEPALQVEVLPSPGTEKIWPLVQTVLVEELRLMPERSLRALADGLGLPETGKAETILLARSASGPSGCLILSEASTLPSQTALISLWVVDPEQRGQGVGRELLRNAIAAARQKGIRYLRARTLASVPGPVRLLWSLGFKVCGQDVLAGETSREILVFERPIGITDDREGGD